MTDVTPVVDEQTTSVEEPTTPPDPNLGKWVKYTDANEYTQAVQVVAINPDTGAARSLP
jgi:hypothetical protein